MQKDTGNFFPKRTYTAMNIAVDLTSMEECLYKLKNCVHKVRKVY